MSQERLLQMITSVLLMGGYEVSERFSIRPRSFDFVARNDRLVLVIKVVSHIDGVNEGVAGDLGLVARYLQGSPLIIGERARDADLERGAVYIRYGIYAISVATLHDYIVENIPPLVYAAPGGLYVNLDGEALRIAREGHNLSLGDLGAMIGVSRRTISKYEAGMGTSLEIAMRIEKIFDCPLVRVITLTDSGSAETSALVAEEPFEGPMTLLSRIGMDLRPMHGAPFQAMVLFHQHTILTGYGPSQKVAKRAALIGNISQVARMHAMCVLTDSSKQKKVGRTLVIGESRLSQIADGDELIEMIGR
ncbi:MAG: transcriptional regulator [Methanomicrobiales archaeon]|jgi:putative transcriptional regulator|nr:transcriptional regulator [Methanomicrobiales archaeon]